MIFTRRSVLETYGVGVYFMSRIDLHVRGAVMILNLYPYLVAGVVD